MIRIVTDSTANVPREILDKYAIKVVPAYVTLDGHEYRDGVDLTGEEFFKKLASSTAVPHSAPPSSAEFVKTFNELLKDSEAVIAIHLSSTLSKIHRNATIASEVINGGGGKPRVIVIDSKVLDLGILMMVLEAAKMAHDGKGIDEIVARVNAIIEVIKGFFYVDTIQFLVRGGRVGKLKGFLASLLDIKPILTVENGEIINKDKAPGREKAIEKILDLMDSNISKDSPIKVGVSDAGAPQDGDRLLAMIRGRFNCEETVRSTIGSAVGVHSGPGALGVCFFPSKI